MIVRTSRVRTCRVTTALAVLLAGALTACGGSDAGPDRPTVVVTTSVLGAVVRDVVGDAADVVVLVPNGADPHEWEPSARDIASVNHASLIVRNGLDLEGGLQDALDAAGDDGVATFVAADHITVRHVRAGEGTSADDPDQAEGAADPHLWMDPLAMRDVVLALGPALAALGIETGDAATRVAADLTALDATVRDILAPVPTADRLLVTGHESLGYFAARYDFRLIGAIVPSLTTAAEASSGDLADLADRIRTTGAKAVFTEIGTPASVADAVGSEAGVPVVELPSHTLPDDGSYASFLTDVATRIATALTEP